MRDRKKRNIIIGSLCCLLVFMGIGYAILSQTLNISGIANMRGNWNVKITNMELLNENKTGRAEEVSHSFTDTTATFTANLYMPGDSIEYRVTVENQGNIDALLKSITPTTTNRSEGIKFSHSEIDNTVLTAGKKITFTMKVEFLEDATSIPNVENVKYNLELVYVQYDGKSEYTPAVETTEEDCFWISDDGTLLSYDRSCGTDNVVIPAKINNIPVKRVATTAFLSTGASVAYTSTGESIYIFKNEEAKTKYIENMRKEGSTDAEINEIMQTSYIYGSGELSTLKLMTAKEYALESDQKFKVYRDSSNTIKIEKTSTDYNMIYFSYNSSVYPYEYYCTTNDVCDLLKEHLRSKDPARNYGITDNSYYEYLYPYEIIPNTFSSHRFGMLNNLEYIYFDGLGYLYGVFKALDFSQAIYMEEFSSSATVMMSSDDSESPISKVILPPNIKTIDLPFAKEVIFPSNSITEVIFRGAPSIESIVFPKTLKVIGNNAFQGNSLTSVVIPSSVVRIGSNAFAAKHLGQGNIASLKFEKDSHLIAIYGNERSDYDEGAFGRNKLSNVIIPKSVEYIDHQAFYSNKLTTVSFETGSKLKYIGERVFTGNQLTNSGLAKLPSSLTSLAGNAFSNNPSLTQITLTSPTDIDGWTNGSTIDGITVVYER